MAEAADGPATCEKTSAPPSQVEAWRPIESLRRLLEEIARDFWQAPFRRSAFDIEPHLWRKPRWGAAPPLGIAGKAKVYEVTAWLPGLDEMSVEVQLVNGHLTIKDNKQKESATSEMQEPERKADLRAA